MMTAAAQDIRFAVNGLLGCVVLDRPQALNALTHEMIQALDAQLRIWAKDSAIKGVLIRGRGEKAFCAGGDIRKLYDEGRAGRDYPFRFYRDEYRLNARIFNYPKPFIALVHGFVMGGGVGLSLHGRYRVASEDAQFSMPETGIGLFPDVGGTYLLSRCPGQVGMYLGLSGERLKAADMIYARLADTHVPKARFDELEDKLAGRDISLPGAVDDVLARFAAAAGEAPLRGRREAIDRCFAGTNVEDMLGALVREGSEWSRQTAASLKAKSPTSMKITCAAIRAAAKADFDGCIRMEFRMANRVARGHDFYEGTRAAVIDKDQKPKWRPDRLEAVTPAEVKAYFEPLPEGDLPLD
jgi:enoyl-CoA hydratase